MPLCVRSVVWTRSSSVARYSTRIGTLRQPVDTPGISATIRRTSHDPRSVSRRAWLQASGGATMIPRKLAVVGGLVLCMALLAPGATPQPPAPGALTDTVQQRLNELEEKLRLAEEGLSKQIDDLMFFRRLEDVAEVDKIR